MKKIFTFLVAFLFIVHNNYGQGSADQYNYSPSNPSGIRYANFAPSDYQPKSTVKKEVAEYSPPAAVSGMYPKKKGKLWGYMGTKGKWAIEPQWEWVGPFGEKDPAGYVYPKWTLGKNNLCRVIDRSGNYISGAYYISFNNDVFYLDGLADSTGYGPHNREFIYKLATQDSILLPEGLSMNNVNLNGYTKWHYYPVFGKDSTGKSRIVAILDMSNLKIVADHLEQYDDVGCGLYGFNDNRLSVWKDKKCGFIDVWGALVIPIQYDKFITDFKDGIATVEKDGVQFKIDEKGKKIE